MDILTVLTFHYVSPFLTKKITLFLYSVPVVSASEICALNKDSSLWLERGWGTRDTTPSRLDDKDCQTKLLQGALGMYLIFFHNNSISENFINENVKGLQHPSGDGTNSEYAEVNLSTFYQGNNITGNIMNKTAPPEPYATTALCVPNQGPRSLVSAYFFAPSS